MCKIKVLQINSVYGCGSTGTIMKLIANQIESAGGESYVAYGRGALTGDNFFVINTTFQQKLSILKTRIFGMHGFYNIHGTRKLIKWIDKIKPDIVHLHNIHGHYINIELLFDYLSKYKIKVIWTLHDCWPFTGHCSHFASLKCEKWKTGCSKCANLRSYPRTYLFDTSKIGWEKKNRIFNQIDDDNLVFASTSDWVKSIQETSFLSKYKCYTINNGIDLNIFKPHQDINLRSSICDNSEFLILGFANKWLLDDNIETLMFLDRELPKDIKILLIGSQNHPEWLPKSRFKVIGFVKDAELLAKYYSISDVFVNLTHEDTFPTVNIESLACGTPVITNDVCGSSEIIDTDTGISVQEYCNDELLNAIMKIYRCGKSAYFDKCVQRANKLYNKENNYKKYIDLYRRIISK